MSPNDEIDAFLAGQPERKQRELQELHRYMLETFPGCPLWFDDGRNADGRVVSNPSIGYGRYSIRYATGASKDFYRIGLSANTTGISVYVLGLGDTTTLRARFGDGLGKASVTGYCIRFRRLGDVDIDTLHAAMRYGMEHAASVDR